MKIPTLHVIAVLAAASLSTLAHAGGKGGAAANVGAGAGSGGANISASGQANTNGAFAEERQFGQDRAAARRSAQGTAHEKGSASSSKSQGPKPVTGASVEVEGAAKSSMKPASQ